LSAELTKNALLQTVFLAIGKLGNFEMIHKTDQFLLIKKILVTFFFGPSGILHLKNEEIFADDIFAKLND